MSRTFATSARLGMALRASVAGFCQNAGCCGWTSCWSRDSVTDDVGGSGFGTSSWGLLAFGNVLTLKTNT